MQHRYLAKRFWGEEAGLAMNPEKVNQYHDVVDLTIGDMDVPTDGRIIDAACRDAHKGYTRYGDPKGDPELIEEIGNYYQEEYGLSVDRKEVYVTASSLLGLQLAMMATLNPGDEVIVFSPYFTPYKAQVELAGGTVVEVPTSAADGYAIHRELLEKAISNKTKGIIFNNPCNPTGAYYTKDTLCMLSQVAIEHDLLVYGDEIYTFYVFGQSFVPLISLQGMRERTITVNSFSKNYLMTGWRVGYLVAPPALIETMRRINLGVVYSAPAMSQRAAIAALHLRGEIRKNVIPDYEKRVLYAAGRMKDIPWFTPPHPQGTFYLFPGIEKTGLNSKDFCDALFEKAHVLVSPGILFGGAGEGHVRVVCTASMENLTAAFDRMDAISSSEW